MKVGEKELEIRWTDGHVSHYPFEELRRVCPCALCVDEMTGELRLDPARIAPDIQIREVHRVGRYALQFRWSDGHSTVIYPYEKLRAMDAPAKVV